MPIRAPTSKGIEFGVSLGFVVDVAFVAEEVVVDDDLPLDEVHAAAMVRRHAAIALACRIPARSFIFLPLDG
jgi:hypothetical protein